MSRTRWIALALLLACLLAWGVERLVVTEREEALALVETARLAVVREDWATFQALVAEDYAERSMDRAALVAWVQGLWRRARVASLAVEVEDVHVEGARAALRVTARPGMPWGGAQWGGRLELERRGDAWKITGVAPDDGGLFGR